MLLKFSHWKCRLFILHLILILGTKHKQYTNKLWFYILIHDITLGGKITVNTYRQEKTRMPGMSVFDCSVSLLIVQKSLFIIIKFHKYYIITEVFRLLSSSGNFFYLEEAIWLLDNNPWGTSSWEELLSHGISRYLYRISSWKPLLLRWKEDVCRVPL